MPSVTIAGRDSVETTYADTGQGRPVVLIPGWPLSGASWSEQVGPMSDAGYRVLAYDRRGFGDSGKPSAGYDDDTLAGFLDGFLGALDLTDVTLVGFSTGWRGTCPLRQRPRFERVRALVLAVVPPYLYERDDDPEGGLDDATIESFQQGVETRRGASWSSPSRTSRPPTTGTTSSTRPGRCAR